MYLNNLLASIFSGGQIALIVVAALIFAGLVAMNIVFAYIWRIKAERRMHNEELQNRRDALLARLEYLKAGGEAEPQSWIDFANDEDDDEDEDEEPAKISRLVQKVNVTTEEDGKQPWHTVLMEVDSLSAAVRQKLGMRAKRFNGKKYYVRYTLGFEAKLRYSDDDTKLRYTQLADEFRSYEGVTLKKNFTNQHIYYGKELLGTIYFAGKRLCVALALNPADYASGKYHGDDKSDKKRFAKTPLVVRILSSNKVDVAKYLFSELSEKFDFVKPEQKQYKYDLEERSQEELIVSGAIRVVIIDEVRPPKVKTEIVTVEESDEDVKETAAAEDGSEKDGADNGNKNVY